MKKTSFEALSNFKGLNDNTLSEVTGGFRGPSLTRFIPKGIKNLFH